MHRGDLLIVPCRVGLLAAPISASVPTDAVLLGVLICSASGPSLGGCFLFARLWGFDDASHFLLQVVESVSAWQVEEGWSCIEVLFFVPSQCPHFEVLVPEWLLVSFGVFVPLVDGWVGLLVLSYRVGLDRSSTGLSAHFGSVDIGDDELSLFVAFAGILALGCVCSFGWQECEDVADFDGVGNGRDAAALFHDAGNFGLLYCAAVGSGL
ncbi:hypothetical protein Nepgr_024766 [Nepenthes gracilis]|uniref:Uncharacterized protein n=1 Tax=Nepenthes gracilis TaxID=150966 RepID=A0AAD3T3H0_NEPGR|nr:hypothetical protein Nepgr_024766 [Nepenthes gracilis]